MFFSHNRVSSLAGITFEPAEGYTHEHAIYDVMAESLENDAKMFKAAILSDMQESAMIHEGASFEEIEALQEGAISNFFNRLKEMFKKLGAKIKAIFRSFMAKFDSIFMKSNKKFVDKYKKEATDKNLTGLKMDYEKPNGKEFILPGAKAELLISGSQITEEFDEDTFKRNAYKNIVGFESTDSEFAEEFHKYHYSEKDEVEVKSIMSEVIATLEGRDDMIKNLKKANTGLENLIGDIIKKIDSAQSKFQAASDDKIKDINTGYIKGSVDKLGNSRAEDISSGMIDKTESGNREKKAKNLSVMSKKAKVYQDVITKATAASMKECKFGATQARKVIVKAIGYTAKTEASIVDMQMEAAVYELDMELR